MSEAGYTVLGWLKWFWSFFYDDRPFGGVTFLGFLAIVALFIIGMVIVVAVIESGPQVPYSKHKVLHKHYWTTREYNVSTKTNQTKHHYRLEGEGGIVVDVDSEIYALVEAGEPFIGQWESSAG